MRLMAAFLAIAIGCSAGAVQARPDDARSLEDGSVERSARAYHAFFDCIGRRYESASQAAIESSDLAGSFNTIRRIAEESDCARHENLVSLQADALLFRGVLAEALFEQAMHEAGVQPQFIGLAPLVSEAELLRIGSNLEARRLALMFVFADCVARNATPGVVALLGTAVMSKEETAAFGAISDTMGACLPASDGTQLQFSPPALRSYLALASYYLQRTAGGSNTRVLASFIQSGEGGEGSQEGQD